ncbi:MAG: glycosyl transferase [Treponema sp.]|nr:glycosyl transferase [Treponema sp.]
MIPKIIHYCWFGGKQLPELAQKCIASWKKFLPNYEIIEWNEGNYDVRKIPYTAQAYDAGKYAFVSDYARFDILYRHGGVYFDTDVEVIRPLDGILARGAFAGVESADHPSRVLNAGLGLASPAASPVYREILDSYETASFLNDDGSMNLTTVVERVSGIFRRHGLSDKNEIQQVAGITVYPAEYFCPKDFETGALHITENTYSIHWFDGSWVSEYDKQLQNQIQKIYKKYGENGFAKFLVVLSGIRKRLGYFGIKATVQHYIDKYIRRKTGGRI